MLSVWARPTSRLVDELGESTNLAMLDGDEIVYVAQAQSRRSMRMFTEVGRRVAAPLHRRRQGDHGPHAGGRGARAPQAFGNVPEHTDTTITDPTPSPPAPWSAEHGYAVDDGEQEPGVRCVAVAVPDAPTRLALSVSGPATRMTPGSSNAVPLLTNVGKALSADLS